MLTSIKAFQDSRHTVDPVLQIKPVYVLFMTGLLDYSSSSKAFDFPRYLILLSPRTTDLKEIRACEKRLMDIRDNLKAIEEDLAFLKRALEKVKNDKYSDAQILLHKRTHEFYLADKNTGLAHKIQFTNFRDASLPQRKNILSEAVELYDPRSYYKFSLGSFIEAIEKAQERICTPLQKILAPGRPITQIISEYKTKQDDFISKFNSLIQKKDDFELELLRDVKKAMPTQYKETAADTRSAFRN